MAPLPKRRILLHSNRTIERADDLSIIFVHEHEPPAEVHLIIIIIRFGSCRCRCCHLCASVYVCGISDEHAVEELDVVRGFGRRGELEAKLRVVSRSMEDVAVASYCCTGGRQSGHGEGARGIEWRFEGAVASSDS